MFLVRCTSSSNMTEPRDRWNKIALLKTARAYASSVVLPDGGIWILGGLGSNSVLKTTEILKQSSDGSWKMSKGPDMPRALFGHCVTKLVNGKILLTGGFDDDDQTDISEEFAWTGDFWSGKWTKKPWSALKTPRYDHVCFSLGVGAYLAGGWKAGYDGRLKTEIFDTDARIWMEVDLNCSGKTIDTELPDVLRSASVGISQGSVALIGGVSCKWKTNANGTSSGMKSCFKHKEVYELVLTTALDSAKWKKTNKTIGTPRSSLTTITVPEFIDFSCREQKND